MRPCQLRPQNHAGSADATGPANVLRRVVMKRATTLRHTLVLLVLLGLMAPAAGVAQGRSAAERDGKRILRDVRAGERDCADLSRDDFVAVGEYAMGRSFPTGAAHEAMDDLMSEMMGERAEAQMHEYLGRRARGCRGGDQPPAGFAGMMSMMGGLGGSGGMMGGPRADVGPGSMMGLGRSAAGDRSNDGDDDWGPAAVVMVVFMGLLLAAALVAVRRWRPDRPRAAAGASPLDVLAKRFARGEIDSDEYERRRRALGGTA